MSTNDDQGATGIGPRRPESQDAGPRMFIPEPGWSVLVKRGSERTFCHMMAPGQDYYHRLLDGEVYLQQDNERLCLRCAARRGILAFEPRRLSDEGPKFLIDAGEISLSSLGSDESQ